MIETDILSIFDNRRAYIYIWYSKHKQCVYVGQTCGSQGVLGRACSHTSKNGTLRLRFYEYYGDKLESTSDWKLFSFSLPDKSKYTTSESAFRLGVEYLVQVKLHEIRGYASPPFRIISNIQYVDQCNLRETKNEAMTIVNKLSNIFSIKYPDE